MLYTSVFSPISDNAVSRDPFVTFVENVRARKETYPVWQDDL